jgi:hypothetical protein
MRGVPVRAPDVVQPEPEQERFQPQLGILEREACGVPRAHEIADRFVVDGRHVHAGEIARAEQAREFDGVAAIGLHLVAGLFRNQRRRHDLTGETLLGQIAMQHVAAGTGLVREHEVRCFRLQASNQFVEVRLPRPERPHEHRGVGGLALGVRDGDGIFVDVETDI